MQLPRSLWLAVWTAAVTPRIGPNVRVLRLAVSLAAVPVLLSPVVTAILSIFGAIVVTMASFRCINGVFPLYRKATGLCRGVW